MAAGDYDVHKDHGGDGITSFSIVNTDGVPTPSATRCK